MLALTPFSGAGALPPKPVRPGNNQLHGVNPSGGLLFRVAEKDSVHFSGGPDKNTANDSSTPAAPRVYMDVPHRATHGRMIRSASPQSPVGEMVARHVRPFRETDDALEHYRDIAEPYAERLAEVASRYYRNNAVLQGNDDEMKASILSALKRKLTDQQMVMVDGSATNLMRLESYYSSQRPLMHFFSENADTLLLPHNKPVLLIVDNLSAADADYLQTQEVLQKIKAKNPNFRFLITRPKLGHDSGYPGYRWGMPQPGNAKSSAQFQTEWVSDLNVTQWIRVLQRDKQVQELLKHYDLALPNKPLELFVNRLQETRTKALERELILGELDSLASFARSQQGGQEHEITEELVTQYCGRFGPPIGPPPKLPTVISADPFSQKPYKIIKPGSIKTSLDDVVGHEQAKKMLTMVLEMVEFPALYEHWNKNDEDATNNNVLLMGEPGNGKTMLAKAIAALGKGTFINTTGSKFVNTYVGMGANNVRQLEAEINALPKDELAVLFIDEIDSLCGKRELQQGGSHEDHKTLGELLTMLEGLESSGRKLLVMAATNVPDELDDALLSRFHYKINVTKPDSEQRKEILQKQMTQKMLVPDETVNLDEIVRQTAGLQGRDLRNLMKLAKMNLINGIPREEKERLNQDSEARKAFKLQLTQKILKQALAELKQGWKDVTKRTAMSDEASRSYA